MREPAAISSPPRCLCVVYGGGHVRAVVPVLLELRRRGWHVDLLALTTAFDVVNEHGLEAWRARDFLEIGDTKIRDYGRRLAAEFSRNGPIPISETEAYLGFGYFDLVEAHGERKAETIHAEKGRQAFSPRTLASRAISRSMPDIVLATNSPRSERATILEAQARGIPALVLNDLLASDSNSWLHVPSYSDHIFVINEFVRERLLASGHDAAKVKVTGNPAFEPMIALRERRERREHTRAAGNKRRILYISQPMSGEDAAHQTAVREKLFLLASLHPDWEMVVRLHPSEREQGEWIRAPLLNDSKSDLAEALYLSDAVVTHGSSVGIEAAIAGLPIILQMGSVISAQSEFENLGFAIISAGPERLETAIAEALGTEMSSEFTMPSNATCNVVSEIEKIHSANDRSRDKGAVGPERTGSVES